MTRNATRRRFLAAAAGVLAAAPLRAFKSHITRARISAITDEIGATQADAMAFAQEFGLQWLELRTLPETKQEFASMTEPELLRWRAGLASNKIKVSFLNTSVLKFTWPGLTAGEVSESDRKKWDRRKDDLAAALRAATVLGVNKIGIFTGTRVARPETAFPVIARTLEELIPLAEQAKVRLAIANDATQNVGTSAEAKALLDLLPSKTIGLSWNPQDALALKETPWPDGYALLPKGRLLNAHIQANGVLDNSSARLNWRAIMEAMQKDNYAGEIGLETHAPADTLIENAKESMRIVLHMAGELS